MGRQLPTSARGLISFLFVTLMLFLVFGWLTFRQHGIGAPLTSPWGSALFAGMFFGSGFIVGSTYVYRIRIFWRFLLCVFAVVAFSMMLAIAEDGGSGQFLFAKTCLIAVMLVVQILVVSLASVLYQSNDGRAQFSISRLLYLTAGVAVLLTTYQLLGQFSPMILFGIVFGGITAGALIASLPSLRFKLGLPILIVAIVGSCFLPIVGTMSSRTYGLLPHAIVATCMLLPAFMLLRKVETEGQPLIVAE